MIASRRIAFIPFFHPLPYDTRPTGGPIQNPPEERPFGSKALINACKDYRHIADFARRALLRKETYDRVRDRWAEIGLPGEAPEMRNFEGFEGLEGER